MRLAIVYDVVFPYVKGGGERRYFEIAKRLAGKHQVHLYSMKLWEGPDDLVTEDGIHLHGVCPARPLYVQGRRSIGQALYYSAHLLTALLREDYDLVDCGSAPYIPIYAAKIWAVRKRRPLVVSWLEYWGDLWMRYLGVTRGVIGWGVERVAAVLPDHILSISGHTADALVRAGVPRSRISVIPCGVDWHHLQGIEPSGQISDIVCVGRLIREKNVALLLHVLAVLKKDRPGISCSVIGDGPERQNLQELASSLGVEHNVKFWGRVDRSDDVYALMKGSRVFVTLSEREGFNIVALEANACGLPVILARGPHNATVELIADGKTGRICDPSHEEIAAAIEELLGDDDLYDRMSRQALEHSSQYDWDLIARDVERFYQDSIRASAS